MTPTAELHGEHDITESPRSCGCGQAGTDGGAWSFFFSLASRFLDGPGETIVLAIVLLAGTRRRDLLPGLWTRARTIEGIAGAAGIGLAARSSFS